MWWLWLVVASLIVLVVWHKREGYTDVDPYTMSMHHQGDLQRVYDILAKQLDTTNETPLNNDTLNKLKKQADENDTNLFDLKNNMAMQNMTKKKNAYPDPNNVDIKAA